MVFAMSVQILWVLERTTEMDKKKKEKSDVSLAHLIALNIVILMIILLISEASGNNQIEGENNSTVYESILEDHNTVTSPANASTNKKHIISEISVETINFSRNLSENDKYLLAKAAMAEAEGESLETKVYVILTILNRVESDDSCFPDTVKEVIFQNNNGVYQFSPVMPGGRWWNVEPNEECWKAVEIVNSMKDDISDGALYFEACKGESWHSRNLEFVCQLSNTRFYK